MFTVLVLLEEAVVVEMVVYGVLFQLWLWLWQQWLLWLAHAVAMSLSSPSSLMLLYSTSRPFEPLPPTSVLCVTSVPIEGPRSLPDAADDDLLALFFCANHSTRRYVTLHLQRRHM